MFHFLFTVRAARGNRNYKKPRHPCGTVLRGTAMSASLPNPALNVKIANRYSIQCRYDKHVCQIDNALWFGHNGAVKPVYVEFGRNVRRLREREGFGLSQDALSKRVGLSRTSVTNIEKGRQQVPLHALYTFADALGVEPIVLLPDKKSLAPERKRVTIDLDKLPSDVAAFVDRLASKEA